ncbi:antitoxin VbhA family protein [Hymenobacter armeniacus]|uniref:Antitoxin VbhA family protein n=1 Tax=Hymenobacter armeniacus TaxID=2771358 RepID=A0ABR8JSF1_9BACT|nr:antitoxin VbhA family protein [Hymenobacter armeniacus]MBD2722030.1 antitoxin VbhA family protein [Hymenobacter armeniacus]
MLPTFFGSIPDDLPADQRAHWQRRQLSARNTLDMQALTGTPANADTVASLQRYVRGEITLAQAIDQVREQMAQEHQSYRQFLNRRNII